MMRKFFKQDGQGLLEAVFAIGILLIVAGAILALSTSNVVGQKASEFQVRANNLAREGIEVVRNIRDSNWLTGNAWDEGINSDISGKFARVLFDEATNEWTVDPAPSQAETMIYINFATSVHSHDPTDNLQTAFSRILEFRNICLQPNGAEYIADTCVDPTNDEKIGSEVTAIVSWNERGQDKEIRLVDLLYAWR